eukprot:173103_1
MSTNSYSTLPKQCCLLAWPWIAGSSMAVIGYNMRNTSLPIRWISGFTIAKICQYIQNYSNDEWIKILPPLFKDKVNTNYWQILNAIFSFHFATGCVGIFGGKKYFKKHGINSYKKAIISGLSDSQVYFKQNKNAPYKALKKLLKIFGSLSIGYVIAKYLKSNPLIVENIKKNTILHLELLGLLVSIQVSINCIPANLHYLIFGINEDIEVIAPFDFVFFTSSIRSFWKNWSRPVGEMLRYAVYNPLGGRDRYWLSVPAVFAMNCTVHYDSTMNLYGYRAMKEWNKAFLVMGTSISLFMLSENIFLT